MTVDVQWLLLILCTTGSNTQLQLKISLPLSNVYFLFHGSMIFEIDSQKLQKHCVME